MVCSGEYDLVWSCQEYFELQIAILHYENSCILGYLGFLASTIVYVIEYPLLGCQVIVNCISSFTGKLHSKGFDIS